MKRRLTTLGLISVLYLALSGTSGAAQSTLELGLPIRCTLGQSCWLVNLVDLDPGPGVKDFLCQSNSYNGHKGTDIAIRDLKAMSKGVTVLAAAAGRVRGVRDGMADQITGTVDRQRIKGRECGNGLVLTHPGGWETQYCHLRKGSVVVKRGQRVNKGQKLGLVGHSGDATFPHVHLSVRHQNRVIDPFVGPDPSGSCTSRKSPLWAPDLALSPVPALTSIFSAGFADVAPKTSAILAGHYQDKALLNNAPALVLWAAIYNIQKGDRVKMRILSPGGEQLHAYESVIKKTQARRILFSGKKRNPLFWPAGTYRGEIVITRKSADGSEQTFSRQREVEMR